MVQGETYFVWKPRGLGLQTRLKTKSDYITKKVGSCWNMWDQGQNEQFTVKKGSETPGSQRFRLKRGLGDRIHIEFKYTFFFENLFFLFLGLLSYFLIYQRLYNLKELP